MVLKLRPNLESLSADPRWELECCKTKETKERNEKKEREHMMMSYDDVPPSSLPPSLHPFSRFCFACHKSHEFVRGRRAIIVSKKSLILYKNQRSCISPKGQSKSIGSGLSAELVWSGWSAELFLSAVFGLSTSIESLQDAGCWHGHQPCSCHRPQAKHCHHDCFMAGFPRPREFSDPSDDRFIMKKEQ